ncbi:MAG: hypothetical protein KME25_06550 [Symplocastrum torsivum CPER-KK1]|uniref:Apea-like HEPN domain-containing protein n=1 Tax=Symplocastrum torsivum CPER-KK1 TaxID=450513 RepID=A0A951PIF7_9CYAN|nr:hypothetical protein [Symplocastrum torsivum CPER-KK1]
MVENITFRYVTPIFNHNPFVNFKHSGQYKDASYTINLKAYDSSELIELLKYGNNATKRKLQNIGESYRFSPSFTNVFLAVDIIQPLTKLREISSNTEESRDIFHEIVSALRLHTTRGLFFDYTYIFSSIPFPESTPDTRPAIIRELAGEVTNYSTLYSLTIPLSHGALGYGKSALPTQEHEPAKLTFQRLLYKEWDEANTFDKLLKLALEYHRLSFTLERVDHAFLILMVVFEALFKKEDENNINNAATRIAQFMATVQKDMKPIRKAFLSRPVTSFLTIRNGIAHGDPTLDKVIVEAQYLELYRYITEAIIKLIKIPDNAIGTNYYDDLEKHINEEFFKLKLS